MIITVIARKPFVSDTETQLEIVTWVEGEARDQVTFESWVEVAETGFRL